jgi:predicted O-methyltransferase YrrM
MTSMEQVDRALRESYAAGVVHGTDGSEFELWPAPTDKDQGAALRSLVAAEKPARVFEVGFAMGLSTLHICAGMLEGGADDPRHYAIDPTETWLWKDAGTQLVDRAGLGGMVEVVREQSQVVLPRWMDEKRVFDIAFIDGDHRFDPAFLDLYYALRTVKMGGLVVVDDMWMPSVRTAVAFFESNVDLELLTDVIPTAFKWTPKPPWRKVRSGKGNTAVLRKPQVHVERDGEHFVPFW